jgi:hypothetical protein
MEAVSDDGGRVGLKEMKKPNERCHVTAIIE